jgi:hypothetical protein
VPDLAHEAGKIPAELPNADPLRRTLGRFLLFRDNTSSLCGHRMCTPETLAGKRIGGVQHAARITSGNSVRNRNKEAVLF